MFEPDLEILVWKKDHEQGEGFYWAAACKNALDAVMFADGYKELFKLDAQIITFDKKDKILYETKDNEVLPQCSYAEKAAMVRKRVR